MNNIVVNTKHHIGSKSNYYTAKVIFRGIKLNITFDNISNELTIHEWYKLSKSQYDELHKKLISYFKNNTEQELNGGEKNDCIHNI